MDLLEYQGKQLLGRHGVAVPAGRVAATVDEAVKAAAFGAYMNQGQICMSTERIIVVESVADAFAEKFTAKVKSMPVGNPVAGNTPLEPERLEFYRHPG